MKRERLTEFVKRSASVCALTAVIAVLPQLASAQAVYQRLAPVDLTGTWVSVVTEDWELRMITPPPGEAEGVPVDAVARSA